MLAELKFGISQHIVLERKDTISRFFSASTFMESTFQRQFSGQQEFEENLKKFNALLKEA